VNIVFRRNVTPVLIVMFMILFSSSDITHSEETQGLKVSESAIATGIENLTPLGESDSFPPSVGKLYAFSKITGATEDTSIKHLWYYGDKLMAEVPLDVKSISWRTYSSKKIIRIWTGQWRVDITTEDGTVLETLNFTVQ
jgi:hypothetical protein